MDTIKELQLDETIIIDTNDTKCLYCNNLFKKKNDYDFFCASGCLFNYKRRLKYKPIKPKKTQKTNKSKKN